MSADFANQYPLNYPINGCFVVQNVIADSNKTIQIFGYPILVGKTRDLLRIPGVSEADIRASLLKGALRNKLLAGEIKIICSDIDLLQFNDDQELFLQVSGVKQGLQAENDGYSVGISEETHKTLHQLIHFIDEGPGEGFMSGAYKEILGQPFPYSIIWYNSAGKFQRIVAKTITRNPRKMPITIKWDIYDIDGITIANTITDDISYTNNIFESSRTRTIQ